MGIRYTAEDMGIELKYLPFHKIAFSYGNNGFTYASLGKNYSETLENIKIILNRTQSKSRRISAATLFEAWDKEVLNPLSVELICASKMRTLLSFIREEINVPTSVYVPSNAIEFGTGGRKLENSEAITQLIIQELDDMRVVLKPDAGTHGKDVMLAANKEELEEMIRSSKPSIINPSGVMAQEFVPKGFYDLRIVVMKKKGGLGFCYPTAMARGGFKDFRTNTYLGNMVFRVKLPISVRREAVKCGEAIGAESDSWVLALDAMPRLGEMNEEEEKMLRSRFDALEPPFNEVRKVKLDPLKKREFAKYTKNIEEAYSAYMSSDPYSDIQEYIQESLIRHQSDIVFHEGNACPEFWEQTRIVGGINIGESLLRCAISLKDQ
jgi:glutathione synthase/RimK-type ligase-like ATP-grasp enzyme